MTLASILVVDADPSTRVLVANELRELGHEVSESEDAGAALAAAQRKRPDLMVCDFALPDLGGVELLSDVRSDEELRNIRVLMTSARLQSNDLVVALESGADDFIGKPVGVSFARCRRPTASCLSQQLMAGSLSKMSLANLSAGSRIGELAHL